MKKYFIIACFIGLTTCLTQNVHAQVDEPLTEYEKGRLSIAYKAIEQINTMYDQYGYSGEALAQRIFIEQMLKDKDLSTPRAILESLEEVISTLCGVTVFMPGDNLKDMYYTNQYRSICEIYADKLMKLDKTISPNDLAYEKKKIKDRAMSNNILMQVKKDFVIWNRKAEYEKTTDYEKRLQDHSEWAFDSICQKAIEKHWKDNLYYKFYEYNADKEILPMKIYYTDNDGNELCSVMYNISVPTDWIKIVKRDTPFFNGEIVSEGIYQNYLFPIKFLLRPYDYNRPDNERYGSLECIAINNETKPLIIGFDKLKIDNKYLSGIERSASYENFYNYKQQLIDTINKYNNKLQEHEFYYANDCCNWGNCIWIHHKETKLLSGSVCNNTQISSKAINNFTGTIMDYKWEEYNKINPSKESFEQFLSEIHLFYDECVEHFENIKEIKKTFPDIELRGHNYNWLDDILSNYSRSLCGRIPYKSKNCQYEPLVKLSNTENKLLQSYYQKICQMLVIENETISEEYKKNGNNFSTPVDFINAYIVSGNYNAELRARKKTK